MRTPLGLFLRESETGALIHPEYSNFEYSDGAETERRIYDSLKTTVDRSCNSIELQHKITDWATEYHFTPVRHNLLRHLDFRPGLHVLELGAGCGAITRQLGETGSTITAIEGSLARARIASARCSDLKNVKVHCSDFNKVLLEPVYDIVTLIGVLEYSPLFIDTHDPITDALRFARSALKPGGRLIVAIENQLGLKYFCGATEDHLVKMYFGLEDLYTNRSVRTFGRRELRTIFNDAGFTNVEFQYPFPDYKLPSALIFEAAFNQPDFLPDEIIRHIYARDYSGKGQDNIDTSMVWPVLARNGLIRDMANSFLIIASNIIQQNDPANTNKLAITYTNDRANQYNTVTEFILTHNNKIITSKRELTPSELPCTDVMTQHLHEAPYIFGRTLHSEILAATKRGELSIVLEHMTMWINYLAGHSTGPSSTIWSTPMPPHFIDCTPFNLLITDSGLHRIDEEWAYNSKYTLGTLALRYLTRYTMQPAAAELFGVANNHPEKQAETIRRVLSNIRLVPNEHAYDEYITMFNEINNIVFPGKQNYASVPLSNALAMPNIDVGFHIKYVQTTEQRHLPKDRLKALISYTKKHYQKHIGWRLK